MTIKHFYDTINLWNLNRNELDIVINAYGYGKESFFLRGKKHQILEVTEIQIYKSRFKINKTEEELIAFLKQKGLHNISLSGNVYFSISSLNKLFRNDLVTDEFIHEEYGYLSANINSEINSHKDLFPQSIFYNTRRYLEKTTIEINSCYKSENYTAAFVLMRKLLETLIIEFFEKFKETKKIKDNNGDYFTLKKLIEEFNINQNQKLGREGKKAIELIKKYGDRGAHNIKFTVRKGDIEGISDEIRLLFEELVSLIDYSN